MRLLKFLFSLSLTGIAAIGLHYSFVTPLMPLPALGKVVNPHSGFWKNAESLVPISNLPLAITSDSLLDDVKVIYDQRQVPHVFAQNEQDAAFVQGYVTARHRLWQMDFMARDAAGRLSEVLGSSLTERDQYKRQLGLLKAAEQTLDIWRTDNNGYKLVESFAAGVNAFMETLHPKDYPLEYKLLDYEPEEWTPLKSALIAKAMAEMLALRSRDIEATNAKAFFSPETYNFLYRDFFPEQLPVIPREVEFPFAEAQTNTATESLSLQQVKEIKGYKGTVRLDVGEENIGSNNWAIARGKTINWNAILAGDPHLYLTLPAIWYELQIHTPQSNTYGVSIPGILGVAIGFNEHLSWSMTNTEHDVADFYTIQWQDSTQQAYLLDGKYIPVEKQIDTIHVKQGYWTTKIIDTTRVTHWGPVIHQSQVTKQPDLALRWLVHDPPSKSDADVFLKVNRAKNIAEFETAIQHFTTPSQNFAYADTAGHIGMFVQGALPRKNAGQGKYIQDGTQSTNGWRGVLPAEHAPKVVDPVWGYVASANQHSTANNYPYYYNSEFFDGYRGRVIQDTLTQNISFSVADMQALQLNNFSLKTYELFNMMMSRLDFDRMNDAEKAIFQRLYKWDYHYDWAKLEPVYFEEWFDIFYQKTWDELEIQTEYEQILYPTEWRTVYILRDLPESSFFDLKSTPDVRETATDIITLAFQEMVAKVYQRLLVEPDLNWSNYRNTNITHLGQITAFSHQKVQTSGYKKAINAMTSHTGPSWRMVVEMNETPQAQIVYPGGQSGNPGSPHYDNFVDTWAKGEYYTAHFMQSATDTISQTVALNFSRKTENEVLELTSNN
ncbi:MAG: penicillin acylase family protein [Saprospiraceae bacterium]